MYWHFDGGGYVGGPVAGSFPAGSLHRYATSVTGALPTWRKWSLQLSTSYWRYADDRNVLIYAPALGYAITDDLDLTARYWFTAVASDSTYDFVHSAGLRATWRSSARTTWGVDYTYGVQLDRNPSAVDLLTLRSHIFTAFVRRLLTRELGVDGAFSIERRTSTASAPNVVGAVFEVGIYTRW